MSLDLVGKNIILISPKYFNYEMEVKKELERRGAAVYFIDDRIKNSTLTKAFFRLKPSNAVGSPKVFKYFKDHLQAHEDKKIDYLIAIIPEGFSRKIIEFYRERLKDTIFILYMWDSIDNRLYTLNILDLFDRRFTFDKNNAQKYGLNFRPLFYTEEYSLIGKEHQTIDQFAYDLSFIGTVHSDRYNVIKKLVKSSKKRFHNFFYFFLQNPVLIFYYYITDPRFRKISLKDISYKALSKSDVLSIISRSLCIVDINHPKQTGLTIRTLEVLGAKRKLITTNKDILTYDFYQSNNILLIDRDNPILDEAFLSTPFQEIDDLIYNKYSIANWVEDILTIE
jgi:hypothetical protein